MDKLFFNAEKSTNIYKFCEDQYKKHLRDNVRKTYKKSNRNRVNNSNYETKLYKKLNIDDRLQQMQETEAFTAVKGRKEGLPNKLLFRFINPSKSDFGKANKSIVSTTSVKQWNSTPDVVKWFKSIPEKSKLSLVDFDVKNFYHSISMKLDTDSIKYAKTLIELTNQDLAIIM